MDNKLEEYKKEKEKRKRAVQYVTLSLLTSLLSVK